MKNFFVRAVQGRIENTCLPAEFKFGFVGDAWDVGDAPEALPLDSAKGTFEKVPLEPPKLFWLRIMKRNGNAY